MLSSIPILVLLEKISNAQGPRFPIKSLNHQFLHANETFAKAVDVPVSDLIGKDDRELGRPEEFSYVAKANSPKDRQTHLANQLPTFESELIASLVNPALLIDWSYPENR